jgi:hypothetical protein
MRLRHWTFSALHREERDALRKLLKYRHRQAYAPHWELVVGCANSALQTIIAKRDYSPLSTTASIDQKVS